jgi:hypothetical protein
MTVVGALTWCYRRRDEVGRKLRLLGQERSLRRGIRDDEARVARGMARKDELDRGEAALLARLEPRLRAVNEAERAALAEIDQRLGATMTRLNQARQALRQAEAAEVNRRLKRLQDRSLAQALTRHRVISARIDGIGMGMKARLLAAGIFTAADIVQVSYQPGHGGVEVTVPGGERVQITGIGPARSAALASWRHRLEADCRAALPAALPPAEAAAIQGGYLTRRQRLDRQAAAATATARQRGDRLRQRYGREQGHLTGEIQAVRARYDQQRSRLADEMAAIRDRLAERQRQLAAVQNDLAAYERVSVRAYLRCLLCLPGE